VVILGYSNAAPSQGKAQPTKSGKSYKITGTATSVDMEWPGGPTARLPAACAAVPCAPGRARIVHEAPDQVPKKLFPTCKNSGAR
jgi:hypothetical protein